MSRALLGLIAGIVFGAIDVGLMLPMSFPDNTTAQQQLLLDSLRKS